jgi:hypothetical protein
MPKMPEGCLSCTKRDTQKPGKCQVLTDPAYPWARYGSCWAYSDDPDWLRKVEGAVERYSGHAKVA